SVVNRLRLLGVRSFAPDIALFGGLATALNMAAGSCALWVLTWPGIAQDGPLTLAFYYLQYAFGGPGFSVPMGLLLAGVCIGARATKLLPMWIFWLGIVIAIVGELSWLNLILPTTFPLPLAIPLTRFPAFVWLIATGFVLPKLAVSSSST